MNSTITRPKILVYRETEPNAGAASSTDRASDRRGEVGAATMVAALEECCETVNADNLADALRLLRRGHFEGVLVSPEVLTGPQRAGLAGRLLLMLDHLGEGVCLVDSAGTFLWTNRRFREWSEALSGPVRDCCRQAAATHERSLATVGTAVNGSTSEQSRNEPRAAFHYAVSDPPTDRHFQVVCHPIVDPVESDRCVLAVVRDETAARRLQDKIDAIDRAGRELLRIDRETVARLDVPQRLEMLEEKIRATAHNLLHFDHFNIRLLDRKTNRIVPVISSGLPEKAEIELFALPTGNGISGYVASVGKSYICRDIRTDPLYLPGLEQAMSSLTVPLRMESEVVGIFNIESRQPDRFHEDDRQFAEIFGRYVAIALNMLELMVVERHRTTGRLAEDLAQEISGPLNDIITETTFLLQDADPAIRRRLSEIAANVEKIRGSLKSVGEVTGGLLGVAGCDKTTRIDPALDGKRILVADDEADIRETIADVLACRGCVVEQAADGQEACMMVLHRDYALVLSDIRMPHKNGYEVFSAVKQRNPETPVILMTGFGYDPSHSIVKARREGLAAVLFKPFKVEAMLEQVKGALCPVASQFSSPSVCSPIQVTSPTSTASPLPAT